jgi:hypothetical protein
MYNRTIPIGVFNLKDEPCKGKHVGVLRENKYNMDFLATKTC